MLFELTEEGKKYIKTGLPELVLIKALLHRPMSFDEAKKKIENFSIALQWAKKKGWVEIKEGKLFVKELREIKKLEEMREQKALEKIAAGKKVEHDILKILIRRKLVKKVVRSEVDRLVGKEVTTLTPKLLKTGLWKKVKFKPFSVEVGKRIYPGKRQPYNRFLAEVRQKLVELGFKEMTGPIIETEFWNFDALYQPQNHPARDWTQTYSLKQPKFGILPKIAKNVKKVHEVGIGSGLGYSSGGWGYKWNPRKAMRLMPRAHCTALSARTLANGPEVPGKYFAIARCYRPDVIDATHGVEFNQVEGIVLDENLSFKHLLGILKVFAKEIVEAKDVKFTTGYFPFTEPSCEMYVKHPKLGWTEVGGAGIFREELTKPLNIQVPVIAWGLGVDRLAMVKLGIKDIRELFTRNLEWLRTQPIEV